MRYDEHLGSMEYDNLINSGDVQLITALRTIKEGQGQLKRGTALALSTGTAGTSKLSVLGTEAVENETLTANCVLCDDVDATEEVKAMVYLTGHFNTNELIVKDEYTITAADIEAFRVNGIFLDTAMK